MAVALGAETPRSPLISATLTSAETSLVLLDLLAHVWTPHAIKVRLVNDMELAEAKSGHEKASSADRKDLLSFALPEAANSINA